MLQQTYTTQSPRFVVQPRISLIRISASTKAKRVNEFLADKQTIFGLVLQRKRIESALPRRKKNSQGNG